MTYRIFNGRRRTSVLLLATALGSCIAAVTSGARAGNLDAFYMSGDAALQAGAVVATSKSGGSIWYNPAGLAAITGPRLDVNVSGYSVRFGAQADFDSSLPNVEKTRLSLFDLNVVPAAVALTRTWGDFGVGIGVFVPSQADVELRTFLSAGPDENGASLEYGYDLSSSYQEYHAGPGVGWAVLENLNVGASLLATYRTQSERRAVSSSVESADGKVATSRYNALDAQGVGLEMILGTQWQIDENFRLGASMRTPSLRLGHAAHVVETSLATTTIGDVEDSIQFENQFDVKAKVLSPFRFHLGLGYEIDHWLLTGEASLLTAFKNEAFGLTERTTWNCRAGARYAFRDDWTFGGGVFTDRSPAGQTTNIEQARIDYYGLTLAVDWRSTFGVISRDGVPQEEVSDLFFGTTVAFSYALGLGEIGGAVVGIGPDGGLAFEEQSSRVVAQELTLHISSTLGE